VDFAGQEVMLARSSRGQGGGKKKKKTRQGSKDGRDGGQKTRSRVVWDQQSTEVAVHVGGRGELIGSCTVGKRGQEMQVRTFQEQCDPVVASAECRIAASTVQ